MRCADAVTAVERDEARDAALEGLERALAQLRHDRFGLYGAPLRERLVDALPVPLTVRQYRLLRSVEEAGPGLRMAALADVMLTDAARATRMVDELQDRGLLFRAVDPADGRRRLVTLTAAGHEVLVAAQRLRGAFVAEVVAGWPAEDLAALGALLERFNDGVRRRPVQVGNGRGDG